MSKSLLDRIPWFNAAKTDAGEGGDPVKGQKPDAATGEAQRTGERETGEAPEETITMEELMEQVRTSVLEEVHSAMTPLIEVVQEMDEYIRAHDDVLTQLVKDDVAKVKGLMAGEDWAKKLYIRSRDPAAVAEAKATAEAAAKAGDTKTQGTGGGVRELTGDETPSSVIFGHRD